MPWSGTKRPYGFSPDGAAASWLPQPASWRKLTVQVKEQDAGSTLSFFRRALQARRQVIDGLGPEIRFGAARPGVLVYHRDPGFTCAINCSSRPYDAGHLGEPVISTAAGEITGGALPPDSAAWFRS